MSVYVCVRVDKSGELKGIVRDEKNKTRNMLVA